MTEDPSKDAIETELRIRIQADADHHGGALPERAALAWSGYLAGLLEWDVITPSAHAALSRLLPRLKDDPAADILKGR